MGPRELEIWLLSAMERLAPGSRPAPEALRRLGVAPAEAQRIAAAVDAALVAGADAPEAARALGWHSLAAVTALLGPATLETASFRSQPHRLHAFNLPLWPAFRFCWSEHLSLPGYARPGPFRRRATTAPAEAVKPWRTLFSEVRDRFGEPRREESTWPADGLVYDRPDGSWSLTFVFDLLQSVERPR